MSETAATESVKPAETAEAAPAPEAAASKSSATATAEKEMPVAAPEKAEVAPAEKPAAIAIAEKPVPAKAEAPAEPVEKPFNYDQLSQCTVRFTNKAWNLFLAFRKEPKQFETVSVRASITARTMEGAQELVQILKTDGNVQEFSLRQKTIELTTTYAIIQLIIKHPQTHMVDAVLA